MTVLYAFPHKRECFLKPFTLPYKENRSFNNLYNMKMTEQNPEWIRRAEPARLMIRKTRFQSLPYT